MFTRSKIHGFILVGLVLTLGSAAWVQAESDPVLKLDSKTEIELDLGVMVDDLVPMLLETLAEAGDEEYEMAKFFLDLLGVEALDRLHMESHTNKMESFSRMTLTLDAGADGGLLAEMLGIPEGKCRFAPYVKADDVVLFMTLENLRGHLELILDLPGRPEFAEFTADMPLDENGDLVLPGLNLKQDLLPLLSGELDLFLLSMPEGGMMNPMEIPVYLVFGTNDGPALRDLILDTVAQLAGEEGGGMVEMIRELPAEQIGDFELTVTPFGGAYAVSEDFLILGATGEPLREMLKSGKGGLKVPDGRSWMYMNGKKYGESMQGFMDLAAMFGEDGDEAEQEMMAMMYSHLFEHLDSETFYTTSRSDRLVVESEVKGSIASGLYAMLQGLVAQLPQMIAAEKEKAAAMESTEIFRKIVDQLDGAFTSYAMDHDGFYPADPTDLVDAGYVDEFSLGPETPAGMYVDGGYTYLPLLNDESRIAGYFFFVYGAGEGTGMDVFTSENILDPEHFRVGSDGQSDGVVTFCYDGLAIEQMESWR